MIISHQHQFIFFAIPKTATHAIRFALRPLLGEMDEEQVGLYVKKKINYPSFQNFTHGHITALEAKRELPDHIWSTYYKFAFVRHPLDRFISYSFYMNRKKGAFKKSPLEGMKKIISNENHHHKILFKPQYNFICDELGNNLMDYTGKFENLENDFGKICEHLKISTEELSHFNATQHQPYLEYYDEELLKLVSDFYQKDLEMFYKK